MKFHVFCKMIFSAILSAYVLMTVAGCAQPAQSSVTSGTISNIESAAEVNNAESSAKVSNAENSAKDSTVESSVDASTDESSAKVSNAENSAKDSTVESSVDASTDESSAEDSNTESSAEISPDESITEISDAAASQAYDPTSLSSEPVKWVFVPASEESASQPDEPTSQPDEPSVPVSTDTDNNDGNIVVMLDPGHDDHDERYSAALGVNEQVLDLKIAKACYDRLLQYEGITPYMTRYDERCPNTIGFEFTGESECIHKRAYLAEEKNADLFVSLHCNAVNNELGTSANGISVIITNYPKYTETTRQLGELIIHHVTQDVDMNAHSIQLSDQKIEKGCYDDGTIKDRYYLLSYNIDYGRPSIIVEHGFMDNPHDNAILKDDEQLKRIGQADADAIAEYYGLKLK